MTGRPSPRPPAPGDPLRPAAGRGLGAGLPAPPGCRAGSPSQPPGRAARGGAGLPAGGGTGAGAPLPVRGPRVFVPVGSRRRADGAPPGWRTGPQRGPDSPLSVPWELRPSPCTGKGVSHVSGRLSASSDPHGALPKGWPQWSDTDVQKRVMRRQPCFLGGTFIHFSVRPMCVGPGAGIAGVAQTDKVAGVLEVTLSRELETTCVLLITAAFLC